MHYSILVIAPPKTADIDAYVKTALAPFDENDEKPHECGWEREGGDSCAFCRANSKWDWYVIGGRWAGLLGGVDVRPISEIPENVQTFGVLTPEGGWIERYTNAKYDEIPEDQWRVEWARLVARYAPDHLGIVVDIHS